MQTQTGVCRQIRCNNRLLYFTWPKRINYPFYSHWQNLVWCARACTCNCCLLNITCIRLFLRLCCSICILLLLSLLPTHTQRGLCASRWAQMRCPRAPCLRPRWSQPRVLVSVPPCSLLWKRLHLPQARKPRPESRDPTTRLKLGGNQCMHSAHQLIPLSIVVLFFYRR